ncbi:Dip2/Utp12 family-domain-containing protein [Triangularia setosa]|uniref:Dip2/Utp12 family-domain-containing protein n=1 Tax=Triangularia setosa TaxID=2587417 RepID=A0AAN7A7L0_9PEZI|nr:Dip2/Utp12 family-domain-containing protein [Podospora setosa]
MSAKRRVATIATPVVKPSAKTRSKTKIDETRAAVSTGLSKQPDEPIELSSDDEDVKDQQQIDQVPEETTQGDVDMDMSGDVEDAESAAPAAFGDLVRGNSTVDVVASLAAETAGASSSRSELQQRHTGPINAASLGTVINQALRTNDAHLLESCLHTSDLKIVENTINRMDSALALELLSKLASRMHRRPGRAMNLMSWMKLTMIAHGGALVTQPDLTARLAELSRVLEERARGLPALLALRGKLEMLDAQLKFRKSAKLAGANRDRLEGKDELSESEDEDQDEPQVVYVEGQESSKALTNGISRAGPADDEDDFPVNHSALPDSDEEDDEEEDEDEDEEDLAAIESLDEDEVDHDDVDEDEEDDSEGDDAGPPAKVQRTLRGRK